MFKCSSICWWTDECLKKPKTEVQFFCMNRNFSNYLNFWKHWVENKTVLLTKVIHSCWWFLTAYLTAGDKNMPRNVPAKARTISQFLYVFVSKLLMGTTIFKIALESSSDWDWVSLAWTPASSQTSTGALSRARWRAAWQSGTGAVRHTAANHYRVVEATQHITGNRLPAMQDIFHQRCLWKAQHLEGSQPPSLQTVVHVTMWQKHGCRTAAK